MGGRRGGFSPSGFFGRGAALASALASGKVDGASLTESIMGGDLRGCLGVANF